MDSFSFFNKVFEINYKNSKIRDIDGDRSAVDRLNEDLNDAFCLAGDISKLLFLLLSGDLGLIYLFSEHFVDVIFRLFDSP
jgi:hypothetical protein